MKEKKDICPVLPYEIRTSMADMNWEGLEEIRLRCGYPVELIYYNRVEGLKECPISIQPGHIMETLNYITGYAIYAMTEEIRQGYLTIKGGHRVGLSGKTTLGRDGIHSIVDISGINIRVARQCVGCAERLLPYMRQGDSIYNTLLCSPPGMGKTTYLRDLIRLLSLGADCYQGLKVGVVDERSEIGASYQGKVQNDLGPRTDLLDGCPKVLGMEMLLRSMSPSIIAVDELGKEEEFLQLAKVRRQGVQVLGTMHGDSMDELLNLYGEQLKQAFERVIWIGKTEAGIRKTEVYAWGEAHENSGNGNDRNRYCRLA